MQIAEKFFLITDARRHMADLGMAFTPGPAHKMHTAMGKTFVPAKPAATLKSLAIWKDA